MKAKSISLAVIFALGACSTSDQGEGNLSGLVQSIDFELPVKPELTCALPPVGTATFAAKFVLRNTPPIRPSDTGFPLDYCPEIATMFITPTGEGMATHLGKLGLSERMCGIPGFRLVADVILTGENGDELYATELSQAGPTIPPPFPNASFTGEFTFTGGTGRFAGARGKASVSARQVGDRPLPGMPANIPGLTAAVLCGWIDLGPE